MEKMEDGDSIAYEKLIPNSTGTERNHTGKINPTTRFRRSGEKMVRRTPSKLNSTQSAMKSHIKETGETKENECNQQECPLRGISKKSVIQDEIVLNDECFDSVIESLLQMPVNKSPSKKPVKTIIINLVRVSEKEVIKKAVTWKPCGNEEIPFVVEDKDALNMSSSCDEFEGFSDVSESEISFRKEVLGRLGSLVSVHTDKALKVNDDETNNDQIVEQFLEDGSDNEKFNLSGSDSMEDFEGFDGITDAVKSLKKFQCINRMLVLQKSHDFKSLKDSCLNELSNTEFEASKSVPVKETRTSNLKDFGTNEHESNTENEPSKIEPTVKETTDCSKSTQESSTTHCRSKTMILTEHYFVKDGRFQCKYCKEEKSSAALIQRHLKICSDAPLSVILSSIQYGLNRPVNKNVQPKKKNEKANSVKAKTTVSLQNQTGDKSENKTKSTLNVIGNKISKPPKKRGRKTKGKDGSVIEEHFVTLLNACDASYSKEPKPPVMILVKNRLKITDSESLKVDAGSKNHIQLPKENVEENNNHLMTDNSTNILTQKVTVDKRIDQSKREDRLPNANILETSDDVEILEVVNTLNTATCKDIENHDKSTLKQSTQTNNFENNKALFKSRLVENSTALSEKKLVGSYHKLKTDSQKIANNEKLTLEFSVTKENISENDKKLPENEFVKKRKIDQAMVINENAASCKKVTFQSDTVTNNPKNRNSPKIVEYDHVRTVTSDNLGSCEMGSRQPVTQTHCKTDDLANRIGLQPIMSTPSYNLADRKGLGPLLSLEFRNHCPHCSVIINGFNNYGQHLLDHRSQPARIDSTRNELPKQDSVDPTRQLLEKQLPKKDGTDSTHQRISSSNWKKKIMKNYFRSKTIDCGSDCTVSSSGYCSSSSIEPEASCSQSSQTGSILPAKHFEPNVVSLGSILAMSSQGPPSNSDSYSQPRVPNPNKTVIDSTGYVLTPIDKYISDEIQKYNNCVCGACLEKSNSLRFLINHSYSAHVTCKVNSKP